MSSRTGLLAQLADDMGEDTAVSWMLAAAIAVHAEHYGLIEAAPTADAASRIQVSIARLATLAPALASLADPRVNPMWRATPAPGLAREVAALWDPDAVADPPARVDGYRVGDLYQQLSRSARKDRALCQTPRFVAELLLELAVDHAVDEWGLDCRVIDPACGTGNILVESLLYNWAKRWRCRAGAVDRLAAALATVHGVDIDAYACAIARYRLLAMAACILRTDFAGLPADLPVQVGAADALLNREEPLLERGRYHAVIANPPYITPRDAKLNAACRAAYAGVCHRRYSLAVPFEVLMHQLTVPGGWVARLTTSSFMKREFGVKLVAYLAGLDLRWVIDTSGAYIPGHGTPTVILVSRNRPPSDDSVVSVLGVRGEPAVPADPAHGVVWSQIREAVGRRLSTQRLAVYLERSAASQSPATRGDRERLRRAPRQPRPPKLRPAAAGVQGDFFQQVAS